MTEQLYGIVRCQSVPENPTEGSETLLTDMFGEPRKFTRKAVAKEASRLNYESNYEAQIGDRAYLQWFETRPWEDCQHLAPAKVVLSGSPPKPSAIDELLTRHPTPWRLVSYYERASKLDQEPTSGGGVIFDGNDSVVVGSSEGLPPDEGVMEAILQIVNERGRVG